MSVREGLAAVRAAMAEAARRAGRDPSDVALVAVTKTVPVERIREAIQAGVTIVGESRVQEAQAKRGAVDSPVEWHLVGHLQTNKAKLAVALFDMIHSLDSLPLAQDLSRHAQERGRDLRVLLQVNLSRETTKTGVDETDLEPLLEQVSRLPRIRMEGLMTLPPYSPSPEEARPFFRRLRQIRDRLACPELPLPHLSMGMSHDFPIAIEEGATLVRVGTAIFGPRPSQGPPSLQRGRQAPRRTGPSEGGTEFPLRGAGGRQREAPSVVRRSV